MPLLVFCLPIISKVLLSMIQRLYILSRLPFFSHCADVKKMCGEKEVLAQVKLQFNSTKDIKMVCTRSLQLSVKVNTRVQKTLEGQLLVHSNGERSTISSKCTELDTVMPQYLGVSKAVLEYVIFCHQDESLWPMSEPAVLKKRFDEIFEALKYTKAIDNIKVLRKKQNEELGRLKILLEQYRVDKDRGEKVECILSWNCPKITSLIRLISV